MVSKQTVLTANNHGPLVNIIAWVTLVAICLATGIKIGVKYSKIRGIERDDLYMIGAMLAAVAQIIAKVEQVRFGLGRHILELSRSQVQATERSEYSSNFFYIASIGLARMAVLQYLLALALSKIRNRTAKAVVAFNVLWTVSATIAIAFQCQLPRPWEVLSDRCFNQSAFWIVVGVFDIILDIMLAAMTTFLIVNVQIAWVKKNAIIGAFSARILIAPLTIMRLYYFTKASKSADRTFDDVNASIFALLVVNIGIVATCIPFSKPFADYCESGVLGGGLRIKTSSLPSSEVTPGQALQMSTRSRQHVGDGFLRIPDMSNVETIVTASRHNSESTQQQSSNLGSDDMIIKQTRGFAVHSDPKQ